MAVGPIRPGQDVMVENVMKVVDAKCILAEKRLDRMTRFFERREEKRYGQ